MKANAPVDPLPISKADITWMRRRLRAYYERNGRDYPWRTENNPYLILNTEILLQRTTAQAVATSWPSIREHLNAPAKARKSKRFLVKLVGRLGLSKRATWILNISQLLEDVSDVPSTLEGLLALPGVGRYTACATLAFAFSRNEGLVDGNVIRVFERFHEPFPARHLATKVAFWLPLAKGLGGSHQFKLVFWGLLDLAAQICVPRKPLCSQCPLKPRCQTGRQVPLEPNSACQHLIAPSSIIIERPRKVMNFPTTPDRPVSIDLFCGAGGLSLGAARAGFAVRGAVDLDPHAIDAHKRNFPNSLHSKADISQLTGQGLKATLGLADGHLAGIIGGPPCQGFSYMGKREKDDVRNTLFVEFFRLVAEALPRFFLAENVPGILQSENSELRDRAISLVQGTYVVLPPMVIAANDYGAPTARTRVFFFGYRPDEMERLTVDDFAPPADAEVVTVRRALCGLRTKVSPSWQHEEQGWRVVHAKGESYYGSRLHGHIARGVGDPIALKRLRNESRASGFLGTVHSVEVSERYANLEPGMTDPISKSRRLDPVGFCPTLRAGTGSDRGSFQAVRPIHPTEPRVITPREAARLQGFPDWFQFSPTKWHSFRQIGSSVSPIVAERILTVIYGALGLAGQEH